MRVSNSCRPLVLKNAQYSFVPISECLFFHLYNNIFVKMVNRQLDDNLGKPNIVKKGVLI